MSLFGSRYIVRFGHAEREFDSYEEGEVSLRASDEKDAEDQVRRLVQSKYRFYTILSVMKKSDLKADKKAKKDI
jgi:hypothetical protein